jgi:hypothetical protein
VAKPRNCAPPPPGARAWLALTGPWLFVGCPEPAMSTQLSHQPKPQAMGDMGEQRTTWRAGPAKGQRALQGLGANALAPFQVALFRSTGACPPVGLLNR